MDALINLFATTSSRRSITGGCQLHLPAKSCQLHLPAKSCQLHLPAKSCQLHLPAKSMQMDQYMAGGSTREKIFVFVTNTWTPKRYPSTHTSTFAETRNFVVAARCVVVPKTV